MDINTLVQLEDDRDKGRLDAVDRLLLVPDLIGYWLTNVTAAERTIASTTGLLKARTRDWDADLIRLLRFPRKLFPDLVDPGQQVAPIRSELGMRGSAAVLTTVGSHDTASAIVGIPTNRNDFVYISCGTWGLVGVESETPMLSDNVREAGFTNEGGVDGRIRIQRNAMGLWVLSETVRSWERSGDVIKLVHLLASAAAITNSQPLFEPDDPVFSAPGNMPARISEWLSQRGLPVPNSQAAFTRCIIESLAEGFARAVRQLGELTGRTIGVIHLVGGGPQNMLLCQALADRTGLEVLAGPVEATAMGNLLVQARSFGMVSGSLEALRSVVAESAPPRAFRPGNRSFSA